MFPPFWPRCEPETSRHIPIQESGTCSGGQEISLILRNSDIQYRIHRNPSENSTLSHMTPVHIVSPYARPNPVSPSHVWGSPQVFVPLSSATKILTACHVSNACYTSRQSLRFDRDKMSGEV